jgi:hypothetical protein
MGPARSQESAGASRRAVSGEESATCGHSRETASALESGGESCWCSNVASGPTPAQLLELVDAAIMALDAGETEVTRVQLHALAEAVRPSVPAVGEMAFERCQGEEKKGLEDPARESDQKIVGER